jgi:tetratricopeptide (TPR) repeat protein
MGFFARTRLRRAEEQINAQYGHSLRMLAEGSFRLAEQELREQVVYYSPVLGRNHPTVLRSAVSLAGVLLNQGRTRAARHGIDQVLPRCETVLGARAELTLRARSLHGGLLAAEGDHAGAEAVFRALDADLEDPHARSANRTALARTLADQGDHARAIELLETAISAAGALPVDERIALAEVRAAAGQPVEPHELLELVGGEDRLSRSREARVRLALSRTHLTEGDPAAALAQARRAIEILTGLNGPGHRTVLLARSRALAAEVELGEPVEAESRALVAALEAELGADHPETLAIRIIAADILGRAGHLTEARVALEAVASTSAATLGERHPTTLLARVRLAILASLDDAGKLHAVAEEVERVLGPGHPCTRTARAALARG